jgi:hypothetical protein
MATASMVGGAAIYAIAPWALKAGQIPQKNASTP